MIPIPLLEKFCIKGSISQKKKKKKKKKKIDTFVSEKFNKLIYGINTIVKCGIWQPIKFQLDDFNFLIVNFPFLSSNTPSAPAYGVYVSQLIRYARTCSNDQDLMERGKVLTKKK